MSGGAHGGVNGSGRVCENRLYPGDLACVWENPGAGWESGECLVDHGGCVDGKREGHRNPVIYSIFAIQ
jgi:hypothetical protein